MPPLDEGDLLYMPTTDPGIRITKARELLQQTDKLIMTFPEVHHVFGKVGRADTATDPAALSMLETTITLEHRQDRAGGSGTSTAGSPACPAGSKAPAGLLLARGADDHRSTS